MRETPHQHTLFDESDGTPTGAPEPLAKVPAVAEKSPPPASSAPPPPHRLSLTADLRAATGLSRTAMDFYLRSGVVRPSARTESGYLLFDEDELALLKKVIAWRSRGLSLKEIKAYIGRQSASEEPGAVQPTGPGSR